MNHDHFFTPNFSLFSLFSLRCKKKKEKRRSILFLSLVSVVLLDTTQEEKLEWTKYPFGAEANTPGVSFAIVAILDLVSFPPRLLSSERIDVPRSRFSPSWRCLEQDRGGKGRRKDKENFSEISAESTGDKMDEGAGRGADSGEGGRGIRSTLWSRCARHTWAPAGLCALSPAPCLFFSC